MSSMYWQKSAATFSSMSRILDTQAFSGSYVGRVREVEANPIPTKHVGRVQAIAPYNLRRPSRPLRGIVR